MLCYSLTSLFLLINTVRARLCSTITIPVNISAYQAVFDQIDVADNFAATKFSLNVTSTRNSGNYTDEVLTGYRAVDGTYNISATFCRPSMGISNASMIQLLIHGIGFDKTYWDLPLDNYNYSYTKVAVDHYGFCTLAIDRFGIGQSSHAHPINKVQAPASMSAVYEITQMLRQGSIPAIPVPFDSVIHVGHSFGSFLSYLLVTIYPNASDGIVLTGFTFNATWFKRTVAGWNLHVAYLNQPLRFGNASLSSYSPFSSRPPDIQPQRIHGSTPNDNVISQILSTTELLDLSTTPTDGETPQNLPPSYLTWSDVTAAITAFLYPPFFADTSAIYAEQTKQPTTIGELLTIGNAAASALAFQGPVLLVSGRQDNIYCGGDCIAGAAGTGCDNLLEAARDHFPAASRFETYLQDDMGHGMNFHFNASGYYRVVQEFLMESTIKKLREEV